MAALGWELNLGFAASDANNVTVIATPNTMLLIGVCMTMLVMFLGL